MASEIRVNKIINRSGLSTVTFSDTGAIVSGIVTANSFSGSGANLTSIPAGQLTGTVADARISTLTSSKLSGALPAISGANLTSLPAQATIANNSDNRVITGGSGVNLNGEAGLTFSSNTLSINTRGSSFAENNVRFQSTGAAYIDHATTGQDINFRTSVSSSLDTSGMTLKSNGNLAFASGKGIDFSATGNSAGTVTSEIFDDYEEGTCVPTQVNGSFSPSGTDGRYTKIGRICTWVISITFDSTGSNNHLHIGNFPFTAGGGRAGAGFVRYSNDDEAFKMGFHVNAGEARAGVYYTNGGSVVQSYSVSQKRFDIVFVYETA